MGRVLAKLELSVLGLIAGIVVFILPMLLMYLIIAISLLIFSGLLPPP